MISPESAVTWLLVAKAKGIPAGVDMLPLQYLDIRKPPSIPTLMDYVGRMLHEPVESVGIVGVVISCMAQFLGALVAILIVPILKPYFL